VLGEPTMQTEPRWRPTRPSPRRGASATKARCRGRRR
jgi:hypothetical protein